MDPLTKDYPELTPYQFAGNNPIENLDLDGLEILDYRSIFHLTLVKTKNTTSFQLDPNGYQGLKSGASQTMTAVHKAYKLGAASDYYKNKLNVATYANRPVNTNDKGVSTTNIGTIDAPKSNVLEQLDNSATMFPTKGRPDSKATNGYNNEQALGGFGAWAITSLCKLGVELSPQGMTGMAKRDIDNMIKAYTTALNAVNGYDFSGYKGDANLLKKDLINYIVDKSLPKETGAYQNDVKNIGTSLIQSSPTLNTQKPLESE